MGISTTTLTRNIPGVNAADVHLLKKFKEIYQRNDNCKHYTEIIDFTICAKDKMEESIRKKAKCTFHLTQDIFHGKGLAGE